MKQEYNYTPLSEPIPISDQVWTEGTIPLVSIDCITYNHENYIRDAIEGFLMQKATFPVEILIHDDASTDNTANIIREYEKKYPQLFKPIYQIENQYSQKSGIITKIQNDRVRGKYIAKCEGDDYWTDPLKLQKQVDFLENNPDYGIVHTDFNYVDIKNNIIGVPNISLYNNLDDRIKNGYIWDYLLNTKGFILTCTVCYRTNLKLMPYTYFYDIGLFLTISRQSKVMYFPDITASYRRNDLGVMLSNPKAVSRKMGLNLLFQLYSYYKHLNTNEHYYLSNIKRNLRLSFANIILRINSDIINNYKLLFFIIKKDPCLLLYLPYYITIIVYNKKIKKL